MTTPIYTIERLRHVLDKLSDKEIEKIKNTDKNIYFFIDYTGQSLFIEFKKKDLCGAFQSYEIIEELEKIKKYKIEVMERNKK
jgi:hypothetical protein